MEQDNTNVARDLKDLGKLAKKEVSEKFEGNGSAKPLAKRAEEFRDKATDLGHDLQDLKKIGGELASDALHTLSKNASGYYDQGLQKAKMIEKNLEKDIQGHPMRYLLIAGGVGLLVGAIFGRRKSAKRD